jgi:hypothetical protein
MAVKTARKTQKKATTKKAPKKIKKGDKYSCSVCGISITVDEACGCVDVCDIICCDKQMKPRKK